MDEAYEHLDMPTSWINITNREVLVQFSPDNDALQDIKADIIREYNENEVPTESEVTDIALNRWSCSQMAKIALKIQNIINDELGDYHRWGGFLELKRLGTDFTINSSIFLAQNHSIEVQRIIRSLLVKFMNYELLVHDLNVWDRPGLCSVLRKIPVLAEMYYFHFEHLNNE